MCLYKKNLIISKGLLVTKGRQPKWWNITEQEVLENKTNRKFKENFTLKKQNDFTSKNACLLITTNLDFRKNNWIMGYNENTGNILAGKLIKPENNQKW